MWEFLAIYLELASCHLTRLNKSLIFVDIYVKTGIIIYFYLYVGGVRVPTKISIKRETFNIIGDES